MASGNDPGLSEWQAARDVLDKFDERLHELRKYGFSFITGLLSVDALLAGPSTVPLGWKLAALIATLSLIVALNLVDRNYRVIQLAATIDAQIIERRSEMNLTQTITRIYNQAHVKFFFQTVYIMFTLTTLLLGWFILASKSYHLLLLAAFAAAMYGLAWFILYPGHPRRLGAVVLACIPVYAILATLYYIPRDITKIAFLLYPRVVPELHYHLTLLVMVTVAIASILWIEKAVDIRPWVDFVIDAYEFEQGESVLVTVSNLGIEDLRLQKEALTVHREHDPEMKEPLDIPELVGSEGLKIRGGSKSNWRLSWSDHRWQFSTEKLSPGLYRVVYHGPIYCDVRDINKDFTAREPNKENPWRHVVRLFGGFKLVHPNKTLHGYNPWRVAQRFSVTRNNETKTNLSA